VVCCRGECSWISGGAEWGCSGARIARRATGFAWVVGVGGEGRLVAEVVGARRPSAER
jgi:hypothetical protein